jgi:hypothetical protein
MARLERDLSFYVPAMMCEVFAFSHKGLENPSETRVTKAPTAMTADAINAN